MSAACPVYPKQQTFLDPVGTSHLCHNNDMTAVRCDDELGIDTLVELPQGRFSKAVMAPICRQDTGLFPRPSETRFACSGPDHASMCKPVAAVLYGVGARLDHSPELLFRLRAVDETEMLSNLLRPRCRTGGHSATGRTH
jgi:hypothetical protein